MKNSSGDGSNYDYMEVQIRLVLTYKFGEIRDCDNTSDKYVKTHRQNKL
jgi:hypothetical protein